MLSPFPGMDPYFEHHWRDVHHRLVTYSCDQIQTQLRRSCGLAWKNVSL